MIRVLFGIALLLSVLVALSGCTRVIIVHQAAPAPAPAPAARPLVNPCGAPGVPGMVNCNRIDTGRIA